MVAGFHACSAAKYPMYVCMHCCVRSQDCNSVLSTLTPGGGAKVRISLSAFLPPSCSRPFAIPTDDLMALSAPLPYSCSDPHALTLAQLKAMQSTTGVVTVPRKNESALMRASNLLSHVGDQPGKGYAREGVWEERGLAGIGRI